MDKNNGLNERAERIPQRTVNLFEQVRQKIILIRDCQVILDVDVAELYGVRTKRSFRVDTYLSLTNRNLQICGQIF